MDALAVAVFAAFFGALALVFAGPFAVAVFATLGEALGGVFAAAGLSGTGWE